MKCPNHLTRDVAGYCSVCGSFFCEDCLTLHEGNFFCRKHYKPISAKIEESQKREAGRKRHARHALVVNFRDGRSAQGICRAMSIREAGFHLELENDQGIATGETLRIRFADVKNVCNVKGYNGKFDPSENFLEYTTGGTELYVQFQDGEVIHGTTMQAYNPDQPRFYLIPKDPTSININVLIEHSSVADVYRPEEWIAKKSAEAEVKRAEKMEDVAESRELSQEETMGDFYFEQHNYTSALEQYQLARNAQPASPRIKKKLLVATLNVGIGCIKSRNYPEGLRWMEKALEIDPSNPHAKKKAKQLQKIIQKTERRMQAYYEGTLMSDAKKKEE